MTKRKVKPKILEAGMEFISDFGSTMRVVEVTRDAIYVEVDRVVPNKGLEVRKREIPRHIWPYFKRPYHLNL